MLKHLMTAALLAFNGARKVAFPVHLIIVQVQEGARCWFLVGVQSLTLSGS